MLIFSGFSFLLPPKFIKYCSLKGTNHRYHKLKILIKHFHLIFNWLRLTPFMRLRTSLLFHSLFRIKKSYFYIQVA